MPAPRNNVARPASPATSRSPPLPKLAWLPAGEATRSRIVTVRVELVSDELALASMVWILSSSSRARSLSRSIRTDTVSWRRPSAVSSLVTVNRATHSRAWPTISLSSSPLWAVRTSPATTSASALVTARANASSSAAVRGSAPAAVASPSAS